MTDLEAARVELERFRAELRSPDETGVPSPEHLRVYYALTVQVRMAEDVAEHEARQARFMRK